MVFDRAEDLESAFKSRRIGDSTASGDFSMIAKQCHPIDESVLRALSESIRQFRQMDGAFTIARNGGSELTLRSGVLEALQRNTGGVAFSEISRKLHNGLTVRLDALVLRGRSGTPGRAITLELKHNMARQPRAASNEHRNEALQLQTLHRTYPEATHYYAHFVVGLERISNANVKLLELHDNVAAAYKRAQSKLELGRSWKAFETTLGPSTLEAKPILGGRDWHARVQMRCWLYTIRRGELVLLKAPARRHPPIA